MTNITVTKIILNPVPSVNTACTIAWRGNGSTGSYTIADNNAIVQPSGDIFAPVGISYDETVYTTGIELMAKANCSGTQYTEVVNNLTTTTTSTSTTTSTTMPSTVSKAFRNSSGEDLYVVVDSNSQNITAGSLAYFDVKTDATSVISVDGTQTQYTLDRYSLLWDTMLYSSTIPGEGVEDVLDDNTTHAGQTTGYDIS